MSTSPASSSGTVHIHDTINEKAPVERDPTKEVLLEPSFDPKYFATARKWTIIIVVSFASLCVTSTSSIAAFTENAVAEEFHVSHLITVLSISLFVLGLAIGPLFVGPLSEIYGRNWIYRISFGLFFVFTWPVAFAPNIACYLVFRFLTGFMGSTFLSVAGGTVSDVFANEKVSKPMALYSGSPFIGPVLGPLLSGFINQNANWRVTYYVMTGWTFAQLVAIVLLVPETYTPVILKWQAEKRRRETNDNGWWAPLEVQDVNLVRAMIVSLYKPFELLIYDRMAFLLNLWTAVILGILYLAFQAFPIIFGEVHGFNMQMTGLTFLGIGIGMIIAIPIGIWVNNTVLAKAKARGLAQLPVEDRLILSQLGGILVPLGLYILAFTTYRQVHWIAPIIASIPFGMGMYFVFSSVFTYLVVAYRPIAASAMAANSAMRCGFAAAFPLFAGFMYERLGTVGATALLAGIMTLMAPLPFVFYKIGARLRAKSRFAAHD